MKSLINKIQIIIIVCSILILGCICCSAAAGDTIYCKKGDLNNDGVINAVDARVCLRFAAKLDTPDSLQKYLADVCDTNDITSSDARKILRVSAKIDNDLYGNSKLKEVEIKNIPDGTITSIAVNEKFDMQKKLSGEYYNQYIFNTTTFSGEVIGMTEYESSWTDDNGEEWGPFSRVIIDVKVDKIYSGDIKANNGIIKVSSNVSLSEICKDSVRLKKGGNYVFVGCWQLDDTYFNYLDKYSPEAKNDISLQMANVTIGDIWNSAFPIENGNVIMYKDYVDNNKVFSEKAVDFKVVKTDKLTSADSLENGIFKAVKLDDFNAEFPKILDKHAIVNNK